MSTVTSAVWGTGFCIYDTYNIETNSETRQVDRFIERYIKYLKTTTNKRFAEIRKIINEPDFNIEDYFQDILDTKPINYAASLYGEDYRIFSNFTPLNNDETIRTTKMLCIWADKQPHMYKAPYKSKKDFIKAMKEQLAEYGMLECLPEDFDIKSHIGTFSTCVY